VAKVLVVEGLLLVGGGGGGRRRARVVDGVAEDGEEAWEGGALALECGRVGVPAHHRLQQAEQEAAVLSCFVVRQAGD